MTASARRSVETVTRSLLTWQSTLRDWPSLRVAVPDATPFVSLYAGGRLRGCMGSDEGARGAEKLARAFLLAMHDTRGVAPRDAERATLLARVSYITSPRRVPLSSALHVLEPGTHGVALVDANSRAAVLMPFVARDGALDARGLLDTLARKARIADGVLREDSGTLFAFESEDIVVSPDPAGSRSITGGVSDLAARWLSQQIDRQGHVCFAVDPRTGTRSERGEAYHARASVLVAALAKHGGYERIVARTRATLAGEIDRGLRGDTSVVGWQANPAQVAGALALAARAGIAVQEALRSFASAHAGQIATSPWHAAQVVGVLGREAPSALWPACVADLEAHPWAPWTTMAAQSLHDGGAIERTARALADSLRDAAPHRGGASVTSVPEIALTAAAIEALAPLRSSAARAAVRRGRAFLERWQLVPERIAPWMQPHVALGAFPASPVRDVLRCDITGHALLALS